jgi:hypothetical protein
MLGGAGDCALFGALRGEKGGEGLEVGGLVKVGWRA